MFKFLRKLFEEKSEKENVSLQELEQWLKSKKDLVYKDANENMKALQQEFNEILERAHEHLKKLETAELHNPNIPVRDIQFMKGNREFYVKRVEICLRHLQFPKDILEVENVYDSFSMSLDNFGKSTARAYMILQQFFEHEAGEIAFAIKQLDMLFKKLKEAYDQTRTLLMNKTEKALQELYHKIQHKKDLEKELSAKEEEYTALKKALDTRKDELRNLETSNETKKLQILQEKKEKLMMELKEKEDAMLHSFSIIEMAMKKFHRITIEYKDPLGNYLHNPIRALARDSDLIILEILPKLKTLINNNAIELKDKKREKTLVIINELNRETLQGFVKEYRELRSGIKTIDKNIQELGLAERRQQILQDIKDTSLKLEQKRNEKDEIAKEIQSIDILKLKNILEADIKHAFKTEVEIL